MILLIACWTGYFALHSVLASSWMKDKVASGWPRAMPVYRMMYNLIAIVLLFPIAWLLWGHAWPVLWRIEGLWAFAAWLLKALAGMAFLVSLKYYDMREFLGLKAEQHGARFVISPFHRFVRHPWYFFALVIIWTSSMNSGQFATAVMVTCYLFIGSRHEERMLIACFGERYAEYRSRVPGLIPLPWKYLKADEAGIPVK
ncbi:MAG: hypothetical protein K2P57_01150 [Burkholderiales bacterium]|nr:hypothetical protein [Burkholderiales bacterium]